MEGRYLVSHWVSVRDGLNATLDKFADSELDFKPFKASMSVRELMLHIAHEEWGELHLGIIQDIPEFPAPFAAVDYPSLTQVRARLDSVHAETMDHIGALEEADLDQVIVTPWGASSRLVELLGHILEHEIHHRGELSLILGILGRIGLDV